MEDESKIYEIGYLLTPLIADDKVSDETNNLRMAIEKFGGVILSEENPKMINLAYSVCKSVSSQKSRFESAYFGSIKFNLNSEKVKKLKESFDKNDLILRFLIIKTIKDSQKISLTFVHQPAPMMQIKSRPKVEEKEKLSDQEIDREIENLLVKTDVTV